MGVINFEVRIRELEAIWSMFPDEDEAKELIREVDTCLALVPAVGVGKDKLLEWKSRLERLISSCGGS